MSAPLGLTARPARARPSPFAVGISFSASRARRLRRRGSGLRWLLCVCLGMAASTPDRAAWAQSGPEILERVRERHAARIHDVDNYTVVQDVRGVTATIHFEKRTVEGEPRFVPVSRLTLVQDLLDQQRMSFVEAALTSGLAAVAPEIAAATYRQMGSLLASLEELGLTRMNTETGDTLDLFRDVIADSATQAGFDQIARQIGGASGSQIGSLAGALAGAGDGSILGQLGKMALGETKKLVVETLATSLGGPLGSAALSLMQGNAGAGLSGVLGGGVTNAGQQAVGGLAKAGMAALMGGLSTVVTQAMMPDLGELDRATTRTLGPDLQEVLRIVGTNVRLAGSEQIDGDEVWVLDVSDPSSLAFANADGFTPGSVALYVDKALLVVRRTVIAGNVDVDGKAAPFSIDTRLEDYREAGGLVYPFRTVTRIQGMDATMTRGEREQLTQMPAALREKFEQVLKQLAQLPPEQRATAERMLAQQMPQFEQMLAQLAGAADAQGAGISVVVREVRVNQGRSPMLQGAPSP